MTVATGEPPLSVEERRATLDAFEQALRRETHILAKRPDLLWQQLHNRLQWADEPLPHTLAPALRRRSAPSATAWLRLRTPPREVPT